MAVDIGCLESFDCVDGTLLAGAELGEADHPGGIVVGEEVEPLEVGSGEFGLCRIGLAEAHFDIGACGVEVDPILANVDGERVGGFGCREVVECGFGGGEQDHEAGIARRLLDGGVEEVEKLRLAAVFEGVEGGFLAEARVLRKCREQRDILIGCAGEVVEAGKCGNEAATQERDVLLACVGGEAGGVAGSVELGEVELFETGVVVHAGVAGGDDV